MQESNNRSLSELYEYLKIQADTFVKRTLPPLEDIIVRTFFPSDKPQTRYICFLKVMGEHQYRTIPAQALARPGDTVRFCNYLDIAIQFKFPTESPFEGHDNGLTRVVDPLTVLNEDFIVEIHSSEIEVYRYLVHNAADNPSIRIVGMSDPEIIVHP